MAAHSASETAVYAQLIDVLNPRVLGWKRVLARGTWDMVMPALNAVAFGVMSSGRCELILPERQPIGLSAGDCLLLTRPSEWILRHGNGGGDIILVEAMKVDFGSTLVIGDPAASTTAAFFGGHLAFMGADAAPLINLLEPVVVLRAQEATRLGSILALMDEESAEAGDSASPLLRRLLEAMLIQALRLAGLQVPTGTQGTLVGLQDKGVGAALRVIHERPAEAWTVAMLASEAAMSRSSFAARFRRLVGTSPAAYLSGWRMGLARRALLHGASLKEAACLAGYGSPRAFSTAFLRSAGQPVGAWLAQARRHPSAESDDR